MSTTSTRDIVEYGRNGGTAATSGPDCRAESPQTPEEILAALVKEGDPHLSGTLLEALIVDHADPVIRSIVRFRLGYSGTLCDRQSIDDVCGEARLQLLTRLNNVRIGNTSIAKFKGYTAVTAHNACSDYLRDVHPVYRSLGDKIKYLIEKDSRLELWKGRDGKEVVGLPEWRLKEVEGISNRISEVWDRLTPDNLDGPSPTFLKGVQMGSLVRRILYSLQQPLRFADLVGLLVEWVGNPRSLATEVTDGPDPKPASTGEENAIWHSDLQRSWEGILRLDVQRRRAILLNLGEGADLRTLVMDKIATSAEIASALEVSIEQFASILPRLPMDNDEIARTFNFKDAQQVNNTRQWARKLLRRLRSSAWK